ncbi:hypothetical protein HN51_030594 [Arachis hypogaea]|uniref:isocitrate dehydrogenase [NAD] catalytic subunit 5, mitochondrial isoform X8 n=1 Tax=Arachis hypogaea TaxID=3818 RepID=UPI003B2104D7
MFLPPDSPFLCDGINHGHRHRRSRTLATSLQPQTRKALASSSQDSREVVEEYSEIKYEEVIIENGCMMNMANPTALMLSGVSILRHLNFHNKADQIQNAIFNTIVEEKYRTADLGGKAKTIEFTNIVI